MIISHTGIFYVISGLILDVFQVQGAGRQVITVGIGRAGDDSPFELGILVHIHLIPLVTGIDTRLFGHAGVITGRLSTAVRSVSTFRLQTNSSRRTITPVGL